jgi:hypothetical protein
MSTLQWALSITQIIVSLMFFVTLGINYLELRTMAEQLRAMRQSTAAQHVVSLLSFMESDDVRAAQMVVYTTLYRKHFSTWTTNERLAASRLCSSFATAGAILRSDLVPVRPLLEGWAPNLRRCHEILEPFIREMQKPENGGPHYWMGFDWLRSQLDAEDRRAGKRRNSNPAQVATTQQYGPKKGLVANNVG